MVGPVRNGVVRHLRVVPVHAEHGRVEPLLCLALVLDLPPLDEPLAAVATLRGLLFVRRRGLDLGLGVALALSPGLGRTLRRRRRRRCRLGRRLALALALPPVLLPLLERVRHELGRRDRTDVFLRSAQILGQRGRVPVRAVLHRGQRARVGLGVELAQLLRGRRQPHEAVGVVEERALVALVLGLLGRLARLGQGCQVGQVAVELGKVVEVLPADRGRRLELVRVLLTLLEHGLRLLPQVDQLLVPPARPARASAGPPSNTKGAGHPVVGALAPPAAEEHPACRAAAVGLRGHAQLRVVVVVVERPVRVLLLRVLEPLLVALLAVTRVGRGGDAVLEVGQLDSGRRRAELGPDERLAEVTLALTRLGALLDPKQDCCRRAAHLALLVLRVHEYRGLPQLLGPEAAAEVRPHGLELHIFELGRPPHRLVPGGAGAAVLLLVGNLARGLRGRGGGGGRVERAADAHREARVDGLVESAGALDLGLEHLLPVRECLVGELLPLLLHGRRRSLA
mmetsp:Transcript_40612/g.93372  ORF Transcript_40612/g.93372 Transcript_40612/m.93372 type:complete len:511 (-) Transcript_40612:3111-4643(-)